jgi:predicted transcriptional regulator
MRSRQRCILIYIMRRTQIYLDDGQEKRLDARAKAEGKTKSALIREAIDQYLSRRSRRAEIEAALKRTAGTLPDLEVPSRDEWDRGYG